MPDSLHPLEQLILVALMPARTLSFEALVAKTGLKEDQVRRALQWLSSKGMVTISESTETKLEVARVPPELRLIELLTKSSEAQTIDSLKKQFESSEEFSAAFGRAKASGWVSIGAEGRPVVGVIPSNGPADLANLLELIREGGRLDELQGAQSAKAEDLIKRGVVTRIVARSTSVSVTPLGARAASVRTQVATGGSFTIDRLSPELLSSGSWRGKNLRPIDVEAEAPRFFPGRRHPVRDFIREVKETYISMGFTELRGDSVHPAFWNFDALFIPQDHPGREMQDTFYLEGLSDERLARKGVVANVAAAHENGWTTGSRGWGYRWRIEEARRLVLRTHNTVLTVRALSESKESEARVFAVSKVYRNENLDYKHLAEFHQMDGIMVGKGLNVRHLMGFLTEFYRKLGMRDVKLWPTFFPYTEPSLEVVGYSEVVKDWIELGGSGVFRPEVTLPLGVKTPVLAWGPGIERLMLMRFGLDDMRELYGNDLSWLRSRVELAGR